MPKKYLSPLFVLGTIGVVIIIWTTSSYNSLIGLEENVDNSFAKIETQLQRRFELIPNVISTVQGVANFERETFQEIVEARSAWQKAGNLNEKISAANGVESALSRLLVTVEAYPDLKASAAFRDLITQLEGTENRIAFSRNEYNDSGTAYNKATRQFPRNLIASLFGFDKEKELFKATEGAESIPVVDFGGNQ